MRVHVALGLASGWCLGMQCCSNRLRRACFCVEHPDLLGTQGVMQFIFMSLLHWGRGYCEWRLTWLPNRIGLSNEVKLTAHFTTPPHLPPLTRCIHVTCTLPSITPHTTPHVVTSVGWQVCMFGSVAVLSGSDS